MNPAYDPQQTEFSDYDKQILELVIERRLAARDVLEPGERGPAAAARGDAGQRRVGRGSGDGAGPGQAAGAVRRAAGARAGPSIFRPPTSTAFNRRSRRSTPVGPPTRGRRWRPSSTHARERKVDQQTWLRIADLAAAIGALTEADDGRRPGRRGRRRRRRSPASIESTRHRIALPLDAAKLGRAARPRAGLRLRLTGRPRR